MDWLNQERTFSRADLEDFGFYPDPAFSAQTFHIQRSPTGETSLKYNELNSEERYVTWLREAWLPLGTLNVRRNLTIVKAVPQPTQEQPGIVLVQHSRIMRNHASPQFFPGPTSLRHTVNTFRMAAKQLFQHRSISDIVCRKSTAVFTAREALWGEEEASWPSIVYNCRSDTEVPGKQDDLVMSATWFPRTNQSFAVIYGTPGESASQVRLLMEKITNANLALHPMILPVAFAELERKRLFKHFDGQKSKIYRRILDTEKRLGADELYKKSFAGGETRGSGETNQLWMSAGTLKTGLESLRVQLARMIEHSQWLSASYLTTSDGGDQHIKERKVGSMIEARLREIMEECDSKARSFDTALGGMNLTTQMEWNYHARREARATFNVASQSKSDSGQMRIIAWMGMLFLPGTFFSTMFSMPFFKWIPDDSKERVSPFLAIWVFLTFGCMAIFIWRLWITSALEKRNHFA